MTKPLKEMIFRPVEGTWRNVSGDSETLAKTLESLGILVDDNCEFARIKDYQNMVSIWYRANAGKVSITIWKINTL